MQHHLLAATLLLGFFTASVAAPAMKPACMTAGQLRERLGQDMPQLRAATISGPEAQVFLDGFNALPPRTDAHADDILVLTLPSAPQAVIALFAEGCLAGRASLPQPLLEALLRRIAEET
jgi:hypothetical protein